jgi:hypothetical protein
LSPNFIQMNKFSNTLLTAVICILALSAQSQNPKEISFKKTLQEVVRICIKKDSVSLLKYIDKKTGIYLIYRPGVSDNFANYEALSFNETTYPYVTVSADINATVLKYTKLPAFSCENEKWSKTGCFVDTTKTDHLLSKTAKNMVDFFEVDISTKTIADFQKLESKSRRVVIVTPAGNNFVLYLSYIDSKWYLTIIDLVTGDCGA